MAQHLSAWASEHLTRLQALAAALPDQVGLAVWLNSRSLLEKEINIHRTRAGTKTDGKQIGSVLQVYNKDTLRCVLSSPTLQ